METTQLMRGSLSLRRRALPDSTVGPTSGVCPRFSPRLAILSRSCISANVHRTFDTTLTVGPVNLLLIAFVGPPKRAPMSLAGHACRVLR